MASYSQDGYNSRVEELREQEYPMLKGLHVLHVDIAVLIQP
jgi:hypothetical protein